MKKQVRDLKIGDVLKGSGSKVITAPTAGLKTPRGKVDIGIEYANGQKRIQTWWKHTEVTVVDAPIPNTSEIPPDALPETETPANQQDITQIELQFKPGEGFWNVTKYPYGGDFGRFSGTETGKVIPGNVKIGGQIRIQLSDGRTVVADARAVANMDRDTVLDLARPITKIV